MSSFIKLHLVNYYQIFIEKKIYFQNLGGLIHILYKCTLNIVFKWQLIWNILRAFAHLYSIICKQPSISQLFRKYNKK